MDLEDGCKEPVRKNLTLPTANPVSFSTDGTRIAAVEDGRVRIVQVESGSVETDFAVDSNIGDVKWHPRRPLLAIARRDAGVKLYTLEGKVRRSLVEGSVEISFDPDGTVLACVTPDHGLRFWRWESEDGKAALPAMSDVDHAAFATDKPLLATLHRGGRLRLWDFSHQLSVTERWSVYVCPEPSALAVDAAANRVAVGCKNGQVAVYEASGGGEVARADYPGEVESVGFGGEPRVFVAAGRDGVKGYYLNRADLIQEACSRVSANLSSDQWMRDIGGDCRTVCPNVPPGCTK